MSEIEFSHPTMQPYPQWYLLEDKNGVLHHLPTVDYVRQLQARLNIAVEALEAVVVQVNALNDIWDIEDTAQTALNEIKGETPCSK